MLEHVLCAVYDGLSLTPQSATQAYSANAFDFNEVWYVIIGAIISFVASLGIILVGRMLDRRGKLKIYYKINGGEQAMFPYGFRYAQDGHMIFCVPMIIEIQNTSRTTRIIRDVNVVLYKNGIAIDHMIQITSATDRVTKNGETINMTSHNYGAENGAYTFVVEPLSVLHHSCFFSYSNRNDKTFDEIQLRYYDERDREQHYFLRKIEHCWSECLFEGTQGWVLLKKE